MGSFSFICKKSGRAVLSSSFSGDAVHLFLLKNGKVIEHMYGNYNSYGEVFTDVTNTDSFSWDTDWNCVSDLMFDENNSNGIAAILDPHWKEGDPYPTTRSEDDPNQGWVMGDVDYTQVYSFKVESPFHKILE